MENLIYSWTRAKRSCGQIYFHFLRQKVWILDLNLDIKDVEDNKSQS